jgi:hypothetical protein
MSSAGIKTAIPASKRPEGLHLIRHGHRDWLFFSYFYVKPTASLTDEYPASWYLKTTLTQTLASFIQCLVNEICQLYSEKSFIWSNFEQRLYLME